MSLRPYKFIVTAVVQEVDADGQVVGEPTTNPVALFGCDALAKWAVEFTEKLAETKAPDAA